MEGLEEGTQQPSLPPPLSRSKDVDQAACDDHLPQTTPPSELADEELRSKILRQVEFYFSDANLPTDDFLLTIIRRSSESSSTPQSGIGWVPIKTLAGFHKMKKLTKNIPTIVAALRTSTELEVSPEGQRVRRLKPLPDLDFEEIRSRTVISWNLPDKPTIEYVMDLFSTVGTVEMARIRKQDHPEPLLTRGLRLEVGKSARDCYALIEYKTREDALKAVEKLHDESNWRAGLRVKLLLPPPDGSSGNGAGSGDGAKKKKAGMVAAVVVIKDEDSSAADVGQNETSSKVEEMKERPKPAWARGATAGTVSSGADAAHGGSSTMNTNPINTSSTTSSTGGGNLKQQPRMPDAGNRGFGMGRGSLPITSSLFKLLSLQSTPGGMSDSTPAAAPGSSNNLSEDT